MKSVIRVVYSRSNLKRYIKKGGVLYDSISWPVRNNNDWGLLLNIFYFMNIFQLVVQIFPIFTYDTAMDLYVQMI